MLRKTYPQPNSFGRNLRSNTLWFAGFYNSHHVSHFATFFINARAEISVSASHFCLQKKHRFPRRTSRMGREEQVVDLRIPWRISRRGRGEGARTEYRRTPPVRTPQLLNTIANCSTVRRGLRTTHITVIRTFHQIIQSVEGMGGVYKMQGHSQRELMTRAYEEFLVEDQQLQ
ncbi:hypothetical protein FXO38_02772 [Capsicum annuum]|uniref:Uncharacterized protein n=1 Tax=Capsicum annuum TaxID=4072 RepID=A0A2G2YVL7_CAPAN|nr:hypothetical protein FXO38_02772 [Capsicum annuum]PHT73817.1 hypothetical protein T459_24602 [Capsicum annuum]